MKRINEEVNFTIWFCLSQYISFKVKNLGIFYYVKIETIKSKQFHLYIVLALMVF